MLNVLIRDTSEIEAMVTTYTVDGEEVTLQDSVRYIPEIVEQLNGKTLVKVYNEDGVYALGIQRNDEVVSYIHPAWIKKIGKTVVNKSKVSLVGDKYIQLNTKKFLNIETMELTNKEDIPICLECGTIISEVYGDGLCKVCFMSKYINVHSYSYKPSKMKFIGEADYYFGLEVEIGYHNKLDVANLMYEKGKNLYLKSDSSIERGEEGRVEIVSHPHSFASLMEKDSWIDYLPQDVVNDYHNGIHIHISKSAWDNDVHYALMYRFMEELAEAGFIETVGGRDFYDYCRYVPSNVHITQLSTKKKIGSNRTRWVNTQNTETIEYRFFQSTTDASIIKSYIQLLNSLIQYTRYHKKTVSSEGYLKYLKKYKRKYKELVARLPEINFDFRTTYTKPKVKTVTSDNLRVKDLYKILEFKLKESDRIFIDVADQSLTASGKLIGFYNKDASYFEFDLKDIEYLKILKE